MYRSNTLRNILTKQLHNSITQRWKSTLPPSSIFAKKPPPPTIPSPPRFSPSPSPSSSPPKEKKIEIKPSSLRPVAPKLAPEKKVEVPKKETDDPKKQAGNVMSDMEEVREYLKAGIPEDVTPKTPLEHLYADYLQKPNERDFFNKLMESNGIIALDPNESNPSDNVIAFVRSPHPGYPGEKFVPVFDTEDRMNAFFGEDHKFLPSEVPFGLLLSGTGLGLMVNPTSPYNFSLESETVKAIGKLLESRKQKLLEIEEAKADESLEIKGDLELVEGMEEERQKYIQILTDSLQYFPEITKAYIEMVRIVPKREETKDSTSAETLTQTQSTENVTTQDKTTTNEDNNNNNKLKETQTTDEESNTPHPLVILEVKEETGQKLFNSIVKRLVAGIEEPAPGQHLDVARYVPAHHDEFIGDTEPFYYGLFERPQTHKPLHPKISANPGRKRFGLVSSKPPSSQTTSSTKTKTKSTKKRNK